MSLVLFLHGEHFTAMGGPFLDRLGAGRELHAPLHPGYDGTPPDPDAGLGASSDGRRRLASTTGGAAGPDPFSDSGRAPGGRGVGPPSEAGSRQCAGAASSPDARRSSPRAAPSATS